MADLGTTFLEHLDYLATAKSVLSKQINEIDSFSRAGLVLNSTDLKKTMCTAIAALQDLDLSDRAAKKFIYATKDVAYDIEDLLEEAATQNLQEKPSGSMMILRFDVKRKKRRQVYLLASEFERILAKLQSMERELNFSWSSIRRGTTPDVNFFTKAGSAKENTSYYHQEVAETNDESLIGRDVDIEGLIDCITSPSNDLQNPNIINVSGPGGIGKSSLVRLVSSDSEVSSCFDFILWISYNGSLSFEDGLQKLIYAIIEASAADSTGFSPTFSESLDDALGCILRGRKFLLIVDDIQDELNPNWNKYLGLLGVGYEGSTVILISRSSIVLQKCFQTFELECISEDDCWSLFKRCAAFHEYTDKTYPFLQDVGRSIVDKCGGVPLAVMTIARLLRYKKDKHHWEQVHKSKLWDGKNNKAWIAWCICLELMPDELIILCASFSMFTRYSLGFRDELVWFWMAQGLLRPIQEKDTPRDIGLRLYDELRLIKCLPFSSSGTGVDSLIGRQFIEDVSEVQISHVTERFLSSDRMHLLWTGDAYLSYKQPKGSLTSKNKARSFIFRRPNGPLSVMNKIFLVGLVSQLKYLRVLFLDSCDLEKLPECICNLKLLRYLSLAHNYQLKVLPRSVCKLKNLQTLDLYACDGLIGLPLNMHELVCLRYLRLSGKLTSIPPKTWTSLHHLEISNCQLLTKLGEEIEMKSDLQSLFLRDCPSMDLLPGNIFHSLKEFHIVDLPLLLEFPDLVLSFAYPLEHLDIIRCQNLNLTRWTGLNHLRSLKSLHFDGLPLLFHLPNGLQSAADSLQHLVISMCENLLDLPESLNYCTCLIDIRITDCPKLVALPQGFHALRNIQVLDILNCPDLIERCERETGDDWHLISHIPKIYLDNKAILSTDASTVQEKPESRAASGAVTSDIIPVTEDYSSTSEQGLSSPPSEGAPEHPHPNSMKHSHPSHPYGMDIDEQASTPVTHHPDTDAIGLEHQGASSSKEPFCQQVIDFVNKVEGKGILLLFREAYEFEKEVLIQLWMALGLLMDEPMEEIGACCFEKLVIEGYILCSVTDFLYKANIEKLETELDAIIDKRNYLLLSNESRRDVASAETLHAIVVCDEVDASIFKTLRGFDKLRTLLFLGNYGSRLQRLPQDLFVCYVSLAALDLSGTHIKELPSSAGKMINLQYLDLSWTSIDALPERIDHFERLQTLKLEGCSRLCALPERMNRLSQLRHLHLDVLSQLAYFPAGMGALVNLRTFSAFPVGTEEGLKICELKFLNEIMGEFCIAKLENVQSIAEAKEASLKSKKKIRKLKLRWSIHPVQEPKCEVDSILNHLCPHSDLEEFHIFCYPGSSFPDWVGDVSFHKLVNITLFRCAHVAMLPSLGILPSLESLELISLNSVVCVDWIAEVGHVAFPKLQKLTIDEMLMLQRWTRAQEGDYPCLVELIIKYCPMLLELSSLLYIPSIKYMELSCCSNLAFSSDEDLPSSLLQIIVENCPLIEERCEEGGPDWLKIQHVPTIWIDQVKIQPYEDAEQ